MLALIADHNVPRPLIRGLRRRAAERSIPVDLVTARDVGLDAAGDPELLAWAAANGRAVLTLDINTLVGFAWDRVRAGDRMPGIFVIARGVRNHELLEAILELSECSVPGEWEGQVNYLPLR